MSVTRRALLKSAAAVFVPVVQSTPTRRTSVAIVGNQFLINGRPTYEGRTWRAMRIEGLLMNALMVQEMDDLNPATRYQWVYPDSGRWDAERNTREFIAAMPEWRRHGLVGFTINLQGGNPRGYSAQQLHNSGFNPDATLRADYLARLDAFSTALMNSAWSRWSATSTSVRTSGLRATPPCGARDRRDEVALGEGLSVRSTRTIISTSIGRETTSWRP